MAKFYKEQNTGNILHELLTLSGSAAPELQELNANTTDAAQEKHVPVVTVNGNKIEVTVGETAHPMQEEHSITVIFIETKSGGQYKKLTPGGEPKAEFILPEGDEFIAAYEYCNLHGLWKA